MAPNGHPSSTARPSDRSPQKNSRPDWLKEHGSVEFQAWQKEHPKQTLTYDEWSSKGSNHIAGLALYYAALSIWDEPESSNEENEQVKIETRPRGGRALPPREPKKTLKTNGTGLARSTGSATPSASAQTDDLSPSAKKKRKARKKYLSQAIVASEESDHEDAAEAFTEATTPSAPTITVNGRRKSSIQKQRKKPISGDTISPEDEEDEPMAMNGFTTSAVASPLPVRSAPKSSVTGPGLEPPRKTILKLNTRKAPKPTKKKILSEETVVDDDTDEGRATAAAAGTSTASAVAEPSITATTEKHIPVEASTTLHENNGTASPDRIGESASAAATRRGLRTRRPAQQKPYSYDAHLFENDETDEDDNKVVPQEEIVVEPPPPPPPPVVQSRPESVPPIPKTYAEAHQLDAETLAILHGEVEPEPEENFRRSKHFKGKGRAWKKEESDEDLEFNPSKKKARAKAKAKALLQQQGQQKQPKKRGRPRKNPISEDVVRDESDEDTTMMSENPSPSWDGPVKKTRRLPRRSTLSEAIVRDDDSDDEEENEKIDGPAHTTPVPEATTPAKRRIGRPRKSEQIPEPAAKEDAVSYTPKGTPNKPSTSKPEPKSYTPKGEPKSYMSKAPEPRPRSLSVDDVESADMDISDSSELDSDDDPVVVSPSGIEAHMASVNADDDDEEELCE